MTKYLAKEQLEKVRKRTTSSLGVPPTQRSGLLPSRLPFYTSRPRIFRRSCQYLIGSSVFDLHHKASHMQMHLYSNYFIRYIDQRIRTSVIFFDFNLELDSVFANRKKNKTIATITYKKSKFGKASSGGRWLKYIFFLFVLFVLDCVNVFCEPQNNSDVATQDNHR